MLADALVLHVLGLNKACADTAWREMRSFMTLFPCDADIPMANKASLTSDLGLLMCRSWAKCGTEGSESGKHLRKCHVAVLVFAVPAAPHLTGGLSSNGEVELWREVLSGESSGCVGNSGMEMIPVLSLSISSPTVGRGVGDSL